MKVAALKNFRHDRLGAVRKGAVVELPEPWASRYLAQGVVERYETKVVRETPLPEAGREQLSPALPADQALPLATSRESASGVRRSRRRSAE
jgi:hypothetical protein